MIKTDWYKKIEISKYRKKNRKKIGKIEKIENSKNQKIDYMKVVRFKIWSKPGANERPKGEQAAKRPFCEYSLKKLVVDRTPDFEARSGPGPGLKKVGHRALAKHSVALKI